MEMKGIRLSLNSSAMTVVVLSVMAASLSETGARQAAEQSRSVWDGVYTIEQANRGQALYRRECAPCHGTDLNGGEEATPLAGPAFLSNWDGEALGDLSERVRVSMPANNPGRLSRREIVDILAHMLRVNRYPEGKEELEPKTETLKLIRIEASKPAKKTSTQGLKRRPVDGRSRTGQ